MPFFIILCNKIKIIKEKKICDKNTEISVFVVKKVVGRIILLFYRFLWVMTAEMQLGIIIIKEIVEDSLNKNS